ncbi:hypothetical protein ACTQ6A_00850 [Lachnospiraceae bacterium LCP25S3_G4]
MTVYKKKILAVIMSFLILGTLFLSYSFLIENVEHDCAGNDCPICVQMELSVQFLSNFKLVISFVPILMALLCVFALIYAVIEIIDRISDTLITLKVELLD